MNFLSRRSIRKYAATPIPKGVVDKIMEVALVAPSGKNAKPWEFILVTDKEVLASLSKAKASGAQMIKDAPLAIVIIGKKAVSDIWEIDCAIASTLIHEKAWDLGIGSCWVHMKGRFDADGNPSDTVISSLLNIPEEFGVFNIIALGYPEETKPAYTEADMDFSKIHINKF